MITEATTKTATIAIITRTDVERIVAQAERDALFQQARAAFVAADYTVRHNQYGHIFIRKD
jgi:hypothetical protein